MSDKDKDELVKALGRKIVLFVSEQEVDTFEALRALHVAALYVIAQIEEDAQVEESN